MTPKCPYFSQCGGCSTQHIPYDLQLKNKKETLHRLIKFDDMKVISDKEFFYRNRMDFVFHKNGVGLRKKGDWKKIIDIKKCVISEEKINVLLQEVRMHFKDCDYFNILTKKGVFKYAVIRVADTSSISFVLNQDADTSSALEQIEKFSAASSVENILVTFVGKNQDTSISSEFIVIKGSDMLLSTYNEKMFHYSAQGFFQNNHAMAVKMHHYVSSLLQNKEKTHLLDLYGGVGTFAIMNAHLFRTVTTVESVKECIDAANKNIKQNNITNAKAVLIDAKNIAKVPLQRPLTIITDPPRSGMHPKSLSFLNTSDAKKIIYISCNPKQLAKELPLLYNYKITSAALLDLFPQTNHAEAVLELNLKE